jgi:predicted ester cyclase
MSDPKGMLTVGWRTGRPRGLLGTGLAMTRAPLLLLAGLLALATGLGLLGVAATLTQDSVTAVPATTADAATAVQRFYAAADLALQSGDATALHAAVAPGYVDHAASSASRPGITGYVQVLAELRAACPDCRLVVEELVVGHDQAAVRLAVQGNRHPDHDASGDGVSLTWSALDVLRIAGGRVAERWSQGDALPRIDSLVADASAEPPAETAESQVSRFILRPGAGLPPMTAAGATELVVEEGALAVRIDGFVWVGQTLDEVHLDAVLGQGKRLTLAPGLSYTIRNDGPTPAVVRVTATEPVAFWPGLGRNPVATP